MTGPAGGIEGAALAYTDVTDYMRAMGVKDEFVASVSHELRTPLTSVLGHLEMISSRRDLPVDAAVQLKVVERNAVRLDTLVSDLLQFARGPEAAIRVVRTRCDVATLVREAVEAARPTASRAGVHLELDSPASLTCDVDPHRLRQVVDNLVSNGVKYTDSGGSVALSLRQVRDGIELEVADTGIGISADDVREALHPFLPGLRSASQDGARYGPGAVHRARHRRRARRSGERRQRRGPWQSVLRVPPLRRTRRLIPSTRPSRWPAAIGPVALQL